MSLSSIADRISKTMNNCGMTCCEHEWIAFDFNHPGQGWAGYYNEEGEEVSTNFIEVEGNIAYIYGIGPDGGRGAFYVQINL